jgi:hypothetical protein
MAPLTTSAIGKKKKRRKKRDGASTSTVAPGVHAPKQRKRRMQRERAHRRQVRALFSLI